MFEATVRDGAIRFRRPDTRWLSTGHGGGKSRADAAYVVSVPEGWPNGEDGDTATEADAGPGDRLDLDAYAAERRERAGFGEAGPTLLTGVGTDHARRARLGPVEAVATAGLSNPAVLPVDARGSVGAIVAREGARSADAAGSPDYRPGTVNVICGTTRDLAPGALANLVAVVAEAKAATLLAVTDAPGTTSDAAIVGCDPAGDPAAFSGSATAVGSAARVCVRDAVLASLASRYDGEAIPRSVADAEYGLVSEGRAEVGEL